MSFNLPNFDQKKLWFQINVAIDWFIILPLGLCRDV